MSDVTDEERRALRRAVDIDRQLGVSLLLQRNHLDHLVQQIVDTHRVTDAPSPAAARAALDEYHNRVCVPRGERCKCPEPPTLDTTVQLTEQDRLALIEALYQAKVQGIGPIYTAVERIAAQRAPKASYVGLCSQCGEQPSVMVKIGTADGWCTRCLDEAAEPGADEADLRSRLACVVEATYWDRPYDVRLAAIRGMCDLTTDGMTAARCGDSMASCPYPRCMSRAGHKGRHVTADYDWNGNQTGGTAT